MRQIKRKSGTTQFPTEAVWPGNNSCQGSSTASLRTRRGLDTSLPSRPFLRYVGNGEV